MNIVKWILARPLIAIWVLGAIAILLTVASGNKQREADSNNHVLKNEIVEIGKAVKKPLNHDASLARKVIESKAMPEMRIHNKTVIPPAVIKTEPVDHHRTKLQNSPEPFAGTATHSANNSNKLPEKNAVEAEDLAQLETDELLLMAREAYWNNGLDEAAQIYQQLIKREPQVIEHKGELGNVYWRQGYPKKAAELYSEIAIPLIESGSSDRVSNMVGFIQLFYPERVEVIMDRLERSNNN